MRIGSGLLAVWPEAAQNPFMNFHISFINENDDASVPAALDAVFCDWFGKD